MVWQMGGVTRVTGMKSDSARSTILVVDDDPAILEYAGGVLEECGYAVLTALNAATALVMLRNNEPIDLLFTDLVMPGSDGIELARRAGEQVPGLKVLFTTGYARNAIVHQGRLDPGVELIVKPFTASSLAAKIRHVLHGTPPKG